MMSLQPHVPAPDPKRKWFEGGVVNKIEIKGEAPVGPKVRELIAFHMAKDVKTLEEGFNLLQSRLAPAYLHSKAWVLDAIQKIRDTAGPNPWRNMSDEEIADSLLKKIEEKKKRK